MTLPGKVLFLFDVDNTLLDNDRVLYDLRNHLEQSSELRLGTATSLSWRSCTLSLAMRTTWVLCSAIGSRTCAIRDCL